jgi:drug/metabolite transporter (DMT)-like permease
VLAIVLALASAIGYGGSDFAAGLASRDASVIAITLLASGVGFVVVAAALPFAASPGPSAGALAWGFGAGLGGTLGALALYLGYRHAAFSVAGPLSAVGSAGFSVLAGLLYGERPTALAVAGIVLALPAIVGVSVSADEGSRTGRAGAGRGVVLGLVAGACFALLFIGLDRAGSDSGLWPVAATGAGELATALVAAAVAGVAARRAAGGGARLAAGGASLAGEAANPEGGAASPGGGGAGLEGGGARGFRLPDARARLLAVITGVAGAAGAILFFFATHQGFLAVTAVLTSLYPAVTIVLARTRLGERLTALRLAGLALAGVCVSLIAVGGAS